MRNLVVLTFSKNILGYCIGSISRFCDCKIIPSGICVALALSARNITMQCLQYTRFFLYCHMISVSGSPLVKNCNWIIRKILFFFFCSHRTADLCHSLLTKNDANIISLLTTWSYTFLYGIKELKQFFL